MKTLSIEMLAQLQAHLLTAGLLRGDQLAVFQALCFMMAPDLAFAVNTYWDPAWFPVFALAALSVSLLGGLISLAIGRLGVPRFISARVSSAFKTRAQSFFEQHGLLVLVISGILPFGFREVCFCLGLSRESLLKTLVALAVGRSIRFFGLGMLVFLSHRALPNLLLEIMLIAGVALVLACAWTYRRYRRPTGELAA